MADTATKAAAPAPAAGDKTKPPKPDQELFDKELARLTKEHEAVMAKYVRFRQCTGRPVDRTHPGRVDCMVGHMLTRRQNAAKAKVEAATGRDKDSPQAKRRAELIAEVNEIRQKQGGHKSARTAKMDQLKRLDEQLRSRIAEQKAARSKISFKSVEDVDKEIERLERQVNGGMMKLVDEKKALAEISTLKKTRKNFALFDEQQKGIDELRNKIKELKDSMNDPESRALSERYDKAQAELDAIKAEQDAAYKSLSSLRDERSRLNEEQKKTYAAIRKHKDDFYAAKKAYNEWEREQKIKARERQRAEHERYLLERRKERAQKMLAEASDPAYLEEIKRANSLLHFLDPASATTEKSPLLADSGLGAQATRKVDDTPIKGTMLVRKEDREEDYAPAVKKGKKGKKGGEKSAEASSSKFSLPPSVVEDCAFLGIDPPMGAADVPETIEKIKKKLEHWKADQAAQTQRVRKKKSPDSE